MNRRARNLVIGFLVLVSGITLLIAVTHYRGRRALAVHKDALIAAGERLRTAELITPPSPEGFEAGDRILAAGGSPSSLPPAMVYVAPGKARVGWAETGNWGTGSNTNGSWAALSAELRSREPALAEARALLGETRPRWRLDFSQGFSMLLPHLAQLKGVAQALSATALYELHQGDLAAAHDSLLALTSLPDFSRDEPLVISQLVGIAVASIAFNACWEALQAEGWTDAQLAELQRAWEKLEFLEPLGRSLEMERALVLEIYARARQSPHELRQLLDSFGPTPAAGGGTGVVFPSEFTEVPEFLISLIRETAIRSAFYVRGKLWLWCWSYDDERHFLNLSQTMLNACREARTNDNYAAIHSTMSRTLNQLRDTGARNTRYLLASSVDGALDAAVQKAARARNVQRLMVTAIALERFEIAKKQRAPNLTALVPDFLPAVPIDSMDGLPLRYRQKEDGTFLLYSVGDDAKDDGGDPTPKTQPSNRFNLTNGRDMVWPVPATREEIVAAEKQPRRR